MNKKSILTAATVLFLSVSAFSQDFANLNKLSGNENTVKENSTQGLDFSIRGHYERPVTKLKLEKAKILSDFIDGYPTNWVDEYVSVELLATCSGKAMRAVSLNDKLNDTQKNILKLADISTDIFINVKFKNKQVATNSLANKEMNVKMTITPETEAVYAGGQNQMKAYLKENVINKISKSIIKQLQESIATVLFTINEEGEIINSKISKTSGDAQTDQLLLEAINKMPQWKPAKNSTGTKVKQAFKFSVGLSGC